MQQAIPPPGVQGQYGPAPGSGYPGQGYPQPQNTGVNPQGGYPMTVRSQPPHWRLTCVTWLFITAGSMPA